MEHCQQSSEGSLLVGIRESWDVGSVVYKASALPAVLSLWLCSICVKGKGFWPKHIRMRQWGPCGGRNPWTVIAGRGGNNVVKRKASESCLRLSLGPPPQLSGFSPSVTGSNRTLLLPGLPWGSCEVWMTASTRAGEGPPGPSLWFHLPGKGCETIFWFPKTYSPVYIHLVPPTAILPRPYPLSSRHLALPTAMPHTHGHAPKSTAHPMPCR